MIRNKEGINVKSCGVEKIQHPCQMQNIHFSNEKSTLYRVLFVIPLGPYIFMLVL